MKFAYKYQSYFYFLAEEEVFDFKCLYNQIALLAIYMSIIYVEVAFFIQT